MVGLNGTLSIATQALDAQTAGIEVANNNIANVNTPGYSRQVVSFSSTAAVDNGATVDEGVTYEGFTSVRDSVLRLAIDSATSEQGSLTAQNAVLSQINSVFSGTPTDIGASVSTLFSDLSGLASNPSDSSGRQTVLTDAAQLANTFHQSAAQLSSASQAANQQVTSTVAKINQLSQQVAKLNSQLSATSAVAQNGGDLEDHRNALTTQLAQLIGVSSTQTGETPTLTTANGSPLVIGANAFALQVTTAADGTAHVVDTNGQDITSQLSGGVLGGSIEVRDVALPAFSRQLNALATGFANAMNAAQACGFDLDGNVGGLMFTLPASGSAAAGVQIALTNGAQIAVSSDGSPGSSGNLNALLAVQKNPLPSGASPTDAYASLVQNIGTAGSEVNAGLTAASTALQQLTAQQGSESGVSIDEETTNLLRYQQAYTAAARVISTVNDMYSVLMNISLGA